MNGLLQSGAAQDAVVPGALVRPATIGEVWDANRVLARGDRMDAEAERLRREYEPILTAINADRAKRGAKPMVNPGYWQNGTLERRPSADNGPFDFASILDKRVTRGEQEAAIFGELAQIRARDPKFLTGVPADLVTFRKGVIDREKKARAGARDVIGRSSGVGQALTGFAGGVWETMHDPVNIASLPLGGGGTTIWAQAGRSALLNGGLELIQQPFVAENREDLGEELTLGEAGLNTLMGAVGGVVGDVLIPQAAKGLAKGVGAAIDAATPLDRKVASALARADLDGVSDAEMASVFGRHVPAEMRTPDEAAAIHVIGRDAEIRASSPYEPTPEGMDAHAARMQASMEAIVRANTADAPLRIPPVVPGGLTTGTRPRLRMSGGRLAADIVSFFREKGYSEGQARGIAAGVAAEAASNHGATNPTSGALGLGQWLGPRQAELIRRYGRNPTRRQQLEFLHHELQGGDHGGRKVLAQSDEASVLRAYIEDFMRPAKGAETEGDLRRGMAALGREMEEAGPTIDLEMDAPVLRDPAIDAERVAIDAPAREAVEIDYADLPQLRRDLFEDDAGWQAAQGDAVDQALGRQDALSGAEPMDLSPVRSTVAQDAAPDEGLGPVSVLSFLPQRGEPGIAVQFDGYQATAVFRDADGVAQGAVQMPVSGEAREIFNEVLSYVRPDYRRQGVATRLYDALEGAGYPVDRLSGTGDLTPAGAALVNARRAARRSAMDASPPPSPVLRDAIAAERLDGGAPVAAEARQLDLFAEPHGDGAKLQADSLDHDLRLAIEAEADAGASFRLEDGSETSLADILADIDEDAAMIETIRGCL